MLTRISLLALLLAACESTPTSELDEGALTCDVGPPGSLANACVKASDPWAINASPLASQQASVVMPNAGAYGVRFVEGKGANEAMVLLRTQEAGTYEIYLGTPNIPFRVVQDGQVVQPGCTSSIAASECTYLRKVGSYQLGPDKLVRLEFGPTTAVRYVRLHVQSKIVAPPTCGPDDLDESAEACTAADAGATTIDAVPIAPFGGQPPQLAPETVYGVRLPAVSGTSGSYAGVVELVPPADGDYELYLGTPNIPLRSMVGWSPALSSCTRYIPATECGLLRRGTRMQLREGRALRLEFGPSANSFVRLTLRRVDAPPSTIKLGPVQAYTACTATNMLDAADLDGDGAIDLVASAPDDAGGGNQICIHQNTGGGAFSLVTQIPTSAPGETRVADFSGDGIPDIVGVAWDGQGPLPGAYLVGQGNFQYTRTTWGNGRDILHFLSTGDFDEDGTLDVVAAWADSEFETDGGFVIHRMPDFALLDSEPAFGSDMRQAVAGDFNGDGHQDVVAANRTNGLKLYLGDGSGTVAFAADATLPGGSNLYLLAHDLDGDGASDIIALHGSTATISYGSMLGLSAPTTLLIPGVFSGGIGVGDFDHDGRLDLAIGNTDSQNRGQITIFVPSGSTYVPAANLAAPKGYGKVFSTKDFNGDGFADLAVPAGDFIQVWLSTP